MVSEPFDIFREVRGFPVDGERESGEVGGRCCPEGPREELDPGVLKACCCLSSRCEADVGRRVVDVSGVD